MAQQTKTIYGFHAVAVRLRTAPSSVMEIYIDGARNDARMRDLQGKAKEASVRLIEANSARLVNLCGSLGHQGVVAIVKPIKPIYSLDDLLDSVTESPLLLVLDGITDTHNLGACLRVADGAGVHAVIAPKDHAAGINAAVSKVACGAAESIPYLMVTNLARTLSEVKERNIWCIGMSDDAPQSIYQMDLRVPTALVLGAEGAGMRRLTRASCDALARIPMRGVVESLNVSVASAICLYEAVRQRAF